MAYYKDDEFEQWLRNDSQRWNDDAAVSSYKSGMGSLIVWLDNHKGLWKVTGGTTIYNFDKYIRNINTISDRESLFSAILNIIQKEIENNPSNKATLQNYKSYLSAYEDFISTVPFEQSAQGLNTTHQKILKNNSSVATYSHDELIQEFIGRITSQDRISMSKDVMFPISLIRKLWPVGTLSWARSVCENIYLIVDDGSNIKELQIKEIDRLKILKSGEVQVFDKSMKYVLLTSYSDPYERLIVNPISNPGQLCYKRKRTETGLSCIIPQSSYFVDNNQNIRDEHNPKQVYLWHVKKMKARSIGDIAIDHDVPISLVLAQNGKSLKSLKQISDLYREISARFGLPVTSKNARVFNSALKPQDESRFKIIGFPFNDLEKIRKEKLVLMSSRENCIKSDS